MVQYTMEFGVLNLAFLGDGLALCLYAAFALYFAYRVWWRKSAPANGLSYVFAAALVGTAAWAGLGIASGLRLLPAATLAWMIPAADLLRYALWFGFLLLLLRPKVDSEQNGTSAQPRFADLAYASLGSALLMLILRESKAEVAVDLLRPSSFTALGLAVVGLILVEQLLRNSSADARWNAKPVCLGLGALFAFDLFVFSQAALFREFDGDALSVRSLAHCSALPLLFLASRRRTDWLEKLHVSRAAVFHSATLLLVGLYLLLISAIGYYVRYTGGEWGRALQLALVFLALLGLAILVLSGALRSQLKVYIGKNFFSYRYDYREEWLRFTATLSSNNSPQMMGETVIRALANLVESPSGALWMQQGDAAVYSQAARWNSPFLDEPVPANLEFFEFLQARTWIIDLERLRQGAPEYRELHTPAWLLEDVRSCWLVPLLVGEKLLGFVLLGRPRAAIELDWEVRDLLKTASRQASSYLAQMQATEALLESKKFDAFNRMSAFVVHDLKNIVTQLSLMMKNAKRLKDNPEFQQDMLDTVENSLEKMRQLMLQLREGEKPHGLSSGVDLEVIVKRLAAAALSKGRTLELNIESKVSTRGHDERIERVLGHVVQNAFDASDARDSVMLALDQAGSSARVVITDRGCGMTEEFIRQKLFRPFQTTKDSGMGIGAYESYQYLKELGGSIKVDSQLNIGTVVTILLPLFHAKN
ncbi:XrtA/PEP-CTERM system histidine kinase PrsK [Paucibacter sp. Y2R2-4]|uniref:XrtA/PEP-CTERM system histidine kinase PrsK n=1 Tax=Paucibacter sp. Y2R2-4 TaxID=2893553 RepID=UPI0021E36469|nr:XrtA/PEP-CTERM system histidine kinase PrsK [Paucibacter sp. Y2R2-4]MCV2348590.1 PEP-CTERM system histidine kinase PrsK [Paucibacter sp. Y2R2-4]